MACLKKLNTDMNERRKHTMQTLNNVKEENDDDDLCYNDNEIIADIQKRLSSANTHRKQH